MKVCLADRLGNVKKIRVGFSITHFLLGPLYSIFRGSIFVALFECLYLFYLLPIPGMEYVCSAIRQLTIIPENILTTIQNVLMLFRFESGYYFIFGILISIHLHIYLSFRVKSKYQKRYMKKKQLLPLEEKDARGLIKYKVANVDVLLAESFDIRQSNTYKSAEENWYENNQNRLKKNPSFDNRPTLSMSSEERQRMRIEQVENSYKLGLISRSEYERKIKALKEKGL